MANNILLTQRNNMYNDLYNVEFIITTRELYAFSSES